MKLTLPKFENEAAEADWWYDHREELAEEMAEAIRNGTARIMTPALREQQMRERQARLAAGKPKLDSVA